MNWDDINWEKSYDAFGAYGQSKLCNVIFTRELAKRLENTQVTTYSLHPGVINTELTRYIGELYGILFHIASIFLIPISWYMFKTPEQGAQTTIYCAVDEEIKNESGRYYSDCKEKKLLKHATKDEDGERLWKMSEEIIQSKISK
jgi:NAD(P)-dependent dehydrogenase (short-subunit alcohol dehydrogenase family)